MSDELSFEIDYSNLSEDLLKQLCEQNGLETSGDKADLLARLKDVDEASANKVEEKICVNCPSCSKTLMYPPEYTEDLKCPKCSFVFDPNVSLLEGKHGLQVVKLQSGNGRQTSVSIISALYCSLILIGPMFLELDGGCLLFSLCLFSILPFIGFAASLGGEGAVL